MKKEVKKLVENVAVKKASDKKLAKAVPAPKKCAGKCKK